MMEYRPNTAAILRRPADGKIFVAERVSVPGAWQFPQGGVDSGEDLLAAVRREVLEETGIHPDTYVILEIRTGYRYRFPKKHRKKKQFEGQEQTYFLCGFNGSDDDIDLEYDCPEFGRYQWIDPNDFQLAWLPKFKRKVFRSVFWDFFGIEIS